LFCCCKQNILPRKFHKKAITAWALKLILFVTFVTLTNFPPKRRAWHFMCAQSFFHFHAAVQKNRPPSLSCLCGTLVGQAEEMENLTTILSSEVFEEEVLDIARVHCESEL